MRQDPREKKRTLSKALLIYNPNAGRKRKIVTSGLFTLEDLKEQLKRYQIAVDFVPTKYPGHATRLALWGVKRGYRLIIAAGGDGTVGEVASGLVGSEVVLGIIPLGSFMNVCRMLSIPNEVDRAVMVLKIGRTRKIDVGYVKSLKEGRDFFEGYFLENVGIGLEAQLQEDIRAIENSNLGGFLRIFKTITDYYGHRAEIILDKKRTIYTRASMVTVSNGPFSGAALPIAPKAKLNDHRLTVSLFKMSKWELFRYLVNAILGKITFRDKIESFKALHVRIITKVERLVHADARIFGTTPIEISILPNALTVITGFPQAQSKVQSLVKRTYLDP